MRVMDFSVSHLPEAYELSRLAYEKERRAVPALPDRPPLPLEELAENGLGSAAFEHGKLVGFLCCVPPFQNAFNSTYATGVFSPMGASAVFGEDREKIFGALYQHAAEKWVAAGAVSHGVCLYSHDTEALCQFFRYGFGMRCVDAIRSLDPLPATPCEGYLFQEMEDFSPIYPLELLLTEHQETSPYFMPRTPDSPEEFRECNRRENPRYFAAFYEGEACAYLRLSETGETFATEDPGYLHISGAYCLPEHRGRGVFQNLVNQALTAMREEGYARLGVDFESINPAGYYFWTKYFTPYTYGVVRRIDERVLELPTRTKHNPPKEVFL